MNLLSVGLTFGVATLAGLSAQDAPKLMDTRYTAEVPSMRAVLGRSCGAEISNFEETWRYATALAAASPAVRLYRYGESIEGRQLFYLVVTSPRHHERIESIRANTARLADPRGLQPAAADNLIQSTPPVTWLAYSVHGNEISCTDAGLYLAYHLAAAVDDEVASTILDNSIVVIDPLQNPDGRERFVFAHRQSRGRFHDGAPYAAERNEPWPGGRTNHDLFDMNRDWFAMTQPETRARVAAYQQWWPVVFVDLHEMGSNSSYYFGPPALPHNPEITPAQHDWLFRYGKNNGTWFDRFGFDYFTREAFDAFYPGYGEGWPTFHGSVGMTFEQASVRGMVVERDDDTTVAYYESVKQHFIASLGTAETTARAPQAALRRFYDDRRTAVEEGRTGTIREFVLTPDRDPSRTRKLVNMLTAQGIEVHRATGPLRNLAALSHDADGSPEPMNFPAGSYVVRLDQPAKRLAFVLLTRNQEMDAEFIEEQRQREERREGAQIYDLTGWSLPLLFNVECYATREFSAGRIEKVAPASFLPPDLEETPSPASLPKVAWIVPAGQNDTARALAELLRRGVRVHCAGKSFRMGERSFRPGSLIVKSSNQATVGATIAAIQKAYPGLGIHATDTSWVEEGIHLGSDEVRYVKPPKILIAWDTPTSQYSGGAARYLIERSYGYPTSIVRCRDLGRVDWSEVDVLVLPEGRGYGRTLGGLTDGLRAWIRGGGTLVTLGGSATGWLASEGLLASEAETRDGESGDDKSNDASDGEKPKFDYDEAIQPDDESPQRTPGAILGVDLDERHWLAFGLGPRTNVVSSDRAIYTPVKLDKGVNVAVFAERDRLLRSGFSWEAKLDQLAQKAYLVHQPMGRGHVVAFAEDPNVRALVDGTDLLFLNAVLLGAAF